MNPTSTSKRLRIIYMGTPEFAVPSLETLVKNGADVVAVVTAPDKPQGRGQKMQGSPVREAALRLNLPVLQPTNLKAEAFLQELRSYQADLQIVVAFRMLPEVVWNMPRLGTFNLHASLLPDYRGAAPINWAIINGETRTGITTFFLKHEIDTGSILFQEEEPIHYDDNVGTLYHRLMMKGAALVWKTVVAIQSGNYTVTPQDPAKAVHHAPKIFKETCEIKWDQRAEQVRNLIRGLSPYPSAWCTLQGKNFKIFTSSVVKTGASSPSGSIRTDNKTFVHIQCAEDCIAIEELQPEGKRKMSIREYLVGNKF